MSPNRFLQRGGLPLVIAVLAALPFLQGCERRGGADPQAPTTSGGSTTVPGTTPGAMPPASAASN
jgi:hypothetical protein